MLLAESKGNKVYFGKLVTFWGEEGGSIYPLEGVSKISCKTNFQGGRDRYKFQVSGGLTKDPFNVLARKDLAKGRID